MLNETHLERYAKVLMWGLETARSARFRKGNAVLVRFDLPALRLAEVLHVRLLERGLNPIVRLMPTSTMEKDLFERAGDRQLVFRTPGDQELYAQLNGSIFLHAPQSLTHLGHIEPARIARATLARKYLRDILDEREVQGAFGWTLGLFPTAELARQAGLDLEAYTRQVVRACFLDRREPLGPWREVYKQAQEIKRRLFALPVLAFRVEADSFDLTITPGEKRQWVGVSGHNIPSFEIFGSPDWRGTAGVYYADMPSFRSGNYVRGVRLEFAKGSVVRAEAQEGAAFLRQQLAMDRGACRLGEFSLTDRRFSKIDRFMAETLYDENYGGRYGNMHIALGSSYADTYAGDPSELTPALRRKLGFNDSALHWDLVNTQRKRVQALLKDGRRVCIYEDGLFRD